MDGSTEWPVDDADLASLPTHVVAILAAPQVSLSGAFSFYDDFRAIGRFPGCVVPRCRFDPRLVTFSDAPERTLTGTTIHPHCGLDGVADAEIVIIPPLLDDGSFLTPAGSPIYPERISAYLRDRHAAGATIAGPCTGAFVVAEAGLLDGREATTHWFYETAFRKRHPKVEVVSRGTLVASGPGARLISGGASVYPSEVSLSLIAAFAGLAAAQQFAHLFGRYWRGDLDALYQKAGHPPPELDDGAVAVACAWIDAHLDTPGLVQAAAAAALLTERTLTRRFQRALGLSPGQWIAKQRIARAQTLLETTRLPVEEVGVRVGYAEAAGFRRAFRRATGLTPSEHRRRFKLPPTPARLQPLVPLD
ncbi:MAG: helix-turn-helix domain-containing protein [Pseudomonadota bacterium]